MHTARQLDESMFTITIQGRDATRADLLPEWGPMDRMGIVIHEPFGTVGASYLLQLAITAYYDSRPQRRDREQPVYPDVYVFHVGGRFGDHAHFDVYPPRKEVFVENDPAAILEAINDRAITFLAVPDRQAEDVQHAWKEPAQALDKISAAWAYAPSGRAEKADVTIVATSPRADFNTKITLHSEESYHERQEARAALGDISVPRDEFLVLPGSRETEASVAERDRIRDRRAELDGPDGRWEAYRQITVRDALGMLHRGPAPLEPGARRLEEQPERG